MCITIERPSLMHRNLDKLEDSTGITSTKDVKQLTYYKPI